MAIPKTKPPKPPLQPAPGFTSKIGGLAHGGFKKGKGKVKKAKGSPNLKKFAK